MSINYEIEYKNGITKINFLKRPDYKEAQKVIDEIAENFPYEKRLWDFTNIKFDFTMKEIEDIAEYGKMKFVKKNKMAMIAPGDLAYGELRALGVYREQDGHAASRVFRTEQEALDWLNK